MHRKNILLILFTKALVQCRKSDLILESEPEVSVLAPLTLAMPLTLISLIKPLALTLKSDVIFDIGPGLLSSDRHYFLVTITFLY